jgi:hypothetical protein
MSRKIPLVSVRSIPLVIHHILVVWFAASRALFNLATFNGRGA